MTNSLQGVENLVGIFRRLQQLLIANNREFFNREKIFGVSLINNWLHGDNSPFPSGIEMKSFLGFAI